MLFLYQTALRLLYMISNLDEETLSLSQILFANEQKNCKTSNKWLAYHCKSASVLTYSLILNSTLKA